MDAAPAPDAGSAAGTHAGAQADTDPRLRAMRDTMVDSQVRPNKVNDSRITAAMRWLPRERFLPAAQRHLAYLDTCVRLPRGRAMPAPMVIARLVQLLSPVAGERALVVGGGAGYGACILAACGVEVTALEDDAELGAIAGALVPGLAPMLGREVRLVAGPLAEGWAPGAPYDLILLEGAVRAIPAAIAGQLVPRTGRLATVLSSAAASAGPGGSAEGRAVLAEATPAGLRPQPAFDCATPLIPSLLPPAGFRF